MRHPAYPRYKPSGVEWLGEVPEGWEVRRLKGAVQRADEKVEADEEHPLPYVGLEHVESWTGRMLPLDPDLVPSGISNRFQEGDTLFGKLRPYLAKGCNVSFEGLCSSEFLVLRTTMDRRFLLYQLLADGFVSLVDSSTYGAKMPRAGWDFIGNCGVALPPLPEQRAIADFLDAQTAKLDTLVAKKRALIEKLKEKRTALISRTVTRGLPPDAARAAGLDPHPRLKASGVEWLGEVPEGWEIRKLSREVRIAEGQVDPEADPYRSMPLIAPNHIEAETGRLLLLQTAEEQGAESGKYLCREGDVLYSKIRPALAKVVIAPEHCLCSADMYPLTGSTKFGSGYLRWLFLSRQFTAWSVLESDRVAMPKINRDTLGELRMPVPPLPEQRAIADYLDRETARIDQLITKVEAAIERLREYRTALITAAVMGRIDVRNGARDEDISSAGRRKVTLPA